MQPVRDGKDRDQGPGGGVPRQWRTKGGRGWRIPVMEKTDLHPEKEYSKEK